jgi:NAD(P)-dependent dehydrogenase (short-subunit alcohol dehydrogenase family)
MANIAITGAARGIGFELARHHAEAGDRVFALARKPSAALTELAAASGGRVRDVVLIRDRTLSLQ